MKRAPVVLLAIAAVILVVGTVGMNTTWLPTDGNRPWADWRFWAMMACLGWTAAGLLTLWRR